MNASKLGIYRPGFLTVIGDCERLDVHRSIVVEDSDLIWEAVPKFIEQHDMILAWEETIHHEPSMAGEYVHQVYARCGARHEDVPGHRNPDEFLAGTQRANLAGATFYWE